MENLPPLVIGDFRYVPQQNKPVLLVFPTGDVAEFNSIETAELYLHSARRIGAPGADQTGLFFFQYGQWHRLH
jgi:hypothetical protein